MIDKFGSVVVFVKDPREVADFWIAKIGFGEVSYETSDSTYIYVELQPYNDSDTTMLLFNLEIAKQEFEDEFFGKPALYFGASDIEKTYNDFKAKGVKVKDMVEKNATLSFKFFDPEGNVFGIVEY